MKRRLFSLAICLFLSVGMVSALLNNVKGLPNDGIVEVNVSPRGTFLHAIDGYPYHGAGDRTYDENLEMSVITGSNYYTVEAPTIVDLQAEGFTEGDRIIISYTAGIYFAGTNNPSNPDSTPWGRLDENNLLWGGLLGVFSTTSTLNDIKSTDRVPGAVESGTRTYDTPKTKWSDILQNLSDKLSSKGVRWYSGQENTNIPYDFKIAPSYGFEITIPRNARFLFLCCIDDLYYDNLGEISVTIEKDTDLDGIPDHWEINGIDVDEDGTVDLDLPALGADWEHKDIFVEVDYMNHYRPNQFALDSVIDAFDKSPVTNPDMVNGINLHIIVDETIPYKEVLSGFGEFSTLKSSYFGTENERLEQKTIEAKKKIFRYCLSVDKIWIVPENWIGTPAYNCPGVAEGIACDDFIVAYGALSDYSNTIENQAALFMHELGHCLGLRHGGGDNVNYKPNYLSIMNYRFQFANLLPERPLDYSRKELPSIDETNINEAVGIGAATKTVWFAHWITPRVYYVSMGDIAIDWNSDANITSGFQLDLNFDRRFLGSISHSYELLTGYNDWANLVYRFRGTPLYRRSATPDDYHIELTNEEIEQMMEDAKNIIEVPAPESQIVVNEDVSVGVKGGDWMEYSVSYTGTPSDDLTKWFRVEVVKVEGTNITAYFEVERINGEKYSFSETYDLKVGFHDTIIISSGLDLGDQFFHDQFGSINLEYIEDYGYAGEERTVVAGIFSDNIAHWDKTTGVLTQFDWTQSPDLKHHWLIEKTSLWGETGIDIILLVGLGIAIVAVLLIILLVFRRKKKVSENEQKPKNRNSPKH